MAKITPIFSAKPDEDMKTYRTKLWKHRAGQWGKILLCAALLLGIGIGTFMWYRSRSYVEYEVTAVQQRQDALNTQYASYQGKLLKYSRDGISCVNAKNEADWSQTYNMQKPIVDVCQTAVVVADKQGNEVYVFDAAGLKTKITTLLPIQQISISAQGVTALLLDGGDASWIYLYDKEGNKLAESRCSLSETGQPLSVGISSDGTKLAVSYLQIQGGSAASCVVFYNFGPVGGNFVDKIVASKVYEDTVIPRIKYLGDSLCAAVSDKGIFFYEGKEIPEEKASVPVKKEIQSIFFGEKEVGLVLEGGDGENASRYEVNLYNGSGSLLLGLGTNLSYSKIELSGNELLLYNEQECEVYTMSGMKKYAGSFDGALEGMYKGSGFRKYILVFSDRTEEIKLK